MTVSASSAQARIGLPELLRRARALLTPRWMLHQLALAVLVFLLLAAFLRIPDGSVLDLLASTLLALLILAAALLGESALLLRLRAVPRTRPAILRGAVVLLLAAALWFAWTTLLDRLSLHDGTVAGFLNSRFPSSLHHLFSYEHVLTALTFLWSAAFWLGTAILITATVTLAPRPALPLSDSSVQRKRLRRFALSSLVILVALLLAGVLTGTLLHWRPGRTLAPQAISLAIRLSIVIVLDLGLASFALALVAALISPGPDPHQPGPGTLNEPGVRYAAGGIAPESSHPRTEESP